MQALWTPGTRRFIRYAIIGVSTLLFDLLLLAGLTELVGVQYYIATPFAFLIAVSINYALSRMHVFRGTMRPVHHGYAYFIGLACLGAFVTTSGVALLVTFFGLYYLLARVLVAGFVGMANYLLNLHFNFKVVGQHP
ncbi:GtrA family protein [Patescibacteria group bacterium]|nr:GtrA family protein [Patescibacteria group bacterium]MBU1501037.1 GtrA family protein [Patescibacteria group bacterium]MBU2080667.1 GtrA family protein [Patescibacteria group bacterium]MBU2124258.1 GtrA family protein [Patescibacteria group bacterium]MBU2194384.1 GtrA family protein [Patescibacteria group bacterium]